VAHGGARWWRWRGRMAVVPDSDPSSLLCVSSFFHFLFPFFSPLRPPSASLCLVLSLSNDGIGTVGGGPQLKTMILLPFLAFSIFLLRSVSVFKTIPLFFSTFFSLKSPLCFLFFFLQIFLSSQNPLFLIP